MNKEFLKNLVLAVMGMLVPVFYSWLVSVFPSFPLSQDSIMSLAVWLVGLIFTGFHVGMIHAKFVSTKFQYRKNGGFYASS